MDPTVTLLTEVIANLGLPTALVVGLGWVLYKLINRTLTMHETNMKKYQDQLDISQTMSTNHLTHVQMSMERLSEKLNNHDSTLEKFGEKIVNSIEKQTEMIRTMLENKDK